MTSLLSHVSPPGITRLRQRVADLFDRLECGCVGGAAIDGTCMDCGAPALM